MMSKENRLEDVSKIHNRQELVHLSWSHAGTELAIVDICGRISIYTVMMMPPINRLGAIRRCVVDPEDHLSAVVGMMWLYNDKIVGAMRTRFGC